MNKKPITYVIEKCSELKCWIVFEVKSRNLKWDVYKAKLKRDCKKWVEKQRLGG